MWLAVLGRSVELVSTRKDRSVMTHVQLGGRSALYRVGGWLSDGISDVARVKRWEIKRPSRIHL